MTPRSSVLRVLVTFIPVFPRWAQGPAKHGVLPEKPTHPAAANTRPAFASHAQAPPNSLPPSSPHAHCPGSGLSRLLPGAQLWRSQHSEGRAEAAPSALLPGASGVGPASAPPCPPRSLVTPSLVLSEAQVCRERLPPALPCLTPPRDRCGTRQGGQVRPVLVTAGSGPLHGGSAACHRAQTWHRENAPPHHAVFSRERKIHYVRFSTEG